MDSKSNHLCLTFPPSRHFVEYDFALLSMNGKSFQWNSLVGLARLPHARSCGIVLTRGGSRGLKKYILSRQLSK